MKDGYKKLNSFSLERTKKGPLRIASIRVGGSPERVMRIKKKKRVLSSIKNSWNLYFGQTNKSFNSIFHALGSIKEDLTNTTITDNLVVHRDWWKQIKKRREFLWFHKFTFSKFRKTTSGRVSKPNLKPS